MDAEDFKLPPFAPDLSLVSLDALNEEILKRTKTCLIITQLPSEDDMRPSYIFGGSFYAALGMLEEVRFCLLKLGSQSE
jgi:hypothetical protein